MKKIIICFLILSCLPLTACIRPYKVEIQQGNIVDAKTLHQLQLGMTKEQVQYIAGTPALEDIFDDKRWYYVSYLKTNGKISEQRKVILRFEQNRLVDIQI